jgi:hypothetical protein
MSRVLKSIAEAAGCERILVAATLKARSRSCRCRFRRPRTDFTERRFAPFSSLCLAQARNLFWLRRGYRAPKTPSERETVRVPQLSD